MRKNKKAHKTKKRMILNQKMNYDDCNDFEFYYSIFTNNQFF